MRGSLRSPDLSTRKRSSTRVTSGYIAGIEKFTSTLKCYRYRPHDLYRIDEALLFTTVTAIINPQRACARGLQ